MAGVDLAVALINVQHNRRGRGCHHEPEQNRCSGRNTKQHQNRPHHNGCKNNLHTAGNQYQPFHGKQIFQGDLQTDRKHQKNQTKLRNKTDLIICEQLQT